MAEPGKSLEGELEARLLLMELELGAFAADIEGLGRAVKELQDKCGIPLLTREEVEREG